MAGVYEDEEIPLALVRRSERTADIGSQPEEAPETRSSDRMRPGPAGGLAGLAAGAAAFGVIHGIAPAAIAGPIHAAAAEWGVAPEVSFAVAYVTASALGALVGACFASVTRYLRRWVPLVVWALVFFVSLALLLLALSQAYGRGIGVAFAPAILVASATYAFVVSFSLPIRKR